MACLARNVVKAPKSSHISPILRSLHWLKINERIENKPLSHHIGLSLPLPFTPYLTLISFADPFLHRHYYSFRAAFMDFNLNYRGTGFFKVSGYVCKIKLYT